MEPKEGGDAKRRCEPAPYHMADIDILIVQDAHVCCPVRIYVRDSDRTKKKRQTCMASESQKLSHIGASDETYLAQFGAFVSHVR
jgi:hypothetical protein